MSHGVFGAIETVSGRVLGYVSGGSELALSEAPHKDHIHFYARSEDESSSSSDARALVPEHIDNGLFLLITPFPGQSLVVRTSTGRLLSTDDLDVSDTVLVLPGGTQIKISYQCSELWYEIDCINGRLMVAWCFMLPSLTALSDPGLSSAEQDLQFWPITFQAPLCPTGCCKESQKMSGTSSTPSPTWSRTCSARRTRGRSLPG